MQKRFYLTPLAVIIFILYFTVFGDRGLLRINHLHRDRDEMQQKLTELKGENDRLKREISALQSDRRYLESIARRDFGLVRGNEVIYQFPQQDKPANAEKKAPAAGDQKLPQPSADQKQPQPAAEKQPVAAKEPAPAAGAHKAKGEAKH